MATQAEVQKARAKLLRVRGSSGPVPEGYVPRDGPKYQYRQPGANPPLPTGPSSRMRQQPEYREPPVPTEFANEPYGYELRPEPAGYVPKGADFAPPKPYSHPGDLRYRTPRGPAGNPPQPTRERADMFNRINAQTSEGQVLPPLEEDARRAASVIPITQLTGAHFNGPMGPAGSEPSSPADPANRTPGIRPDLGAEMQSDLDEQVKLNMAGEMAKRKAARSLPEALAAADPPANVNTPPRETILKQALGEPATEPYEPIRIAPKGPNNDAEMIPGTGGPGAPGELRTDTVEVEPVWTPQASLEREMDLWQQKQKDFSGMEGVERGRKNDARRDAQGGMLLSTFGGSRLAPRGGEVFQKAMASKPIRPNAADLGYFDPETGDYVENPTNAKTRRDKILSGRIDAMNRQMNVEAQQQQNRLKQLELTTDKGEERQLRREIEAAKIRQKELDREAKFAIETAKYGQGVKGLQSLGGGPVYVKDGGYVNAQGEPTEALSHSDATKRQKAIRGAKHNLGELNRLTEDIVKYAGGFGKDVGMASMSPTILGKYLTSEEIATRVGVYRQAYQTIKNLAGAALSPAESERIEAFVPGPNDPPGVVAVKVWEAQREFNEILAENGEPLMDMGPRPNFGLRDSPKGPAERTGEDVIPNIPRSGGATSGTSDAFPPVGTVYELPDGGGTLKRVR